MVNPAIIELSIQLFVRTKNGACAHSGQQAPLKSMQTTLFAFSDDFILVYDTLYRMQNKAAISP